MVLTSFSITTPNGGQANFGVRPDTNDGALVNGILGEDEYRLRGLHFDGWALDIGSHVGTVGIALAVDNPTLKVIAVEPVPDNAEVIRHNVELNNLALRVFVEEAGAGKVGAASTSCRYAYTASAIADQGFVEQNRYIGNIWRMSANATGTQIDVPVVTVKGLADKYGTERFRLCKIDCEGCEWEFLSTGAGLIDEIVGEWHDAGPDQIGKLLRRTHDVTILRDYGGSGIFRAIRK